MEALELQVFLKKTKRENSKVLHFLLLRYLQLEMELPKPPPVPEEEVEYCAKVKVGNSFKKRLV